MNCNMDRKLSIRFYKDREVRAVWDGEYNKWWFSVLDIIGVLNEQVISDQYYLGSNKTNLPFSSYLYTFRHMKVPD